MSSKILFVYNYKKLFEILNEIKENLNFELQFINEVEYKKLDLSNFKNFLIIGMNFPHNIKNHLLIDKFPIKFSKLIEKINLSFLRNQFNNQADLKTGKYTLDLNSRSINFNGTSLSLTEKESDLILFINSNKRVDLKELQLNVWGYSSTNLETHTVETHIYRLRKKMLETFKDKNFIKHDKKGYFIN